MTRILRSILCGAVCLLAGVSSSQPAALEGARSPLDIAREHERLVASDLGVLAPGEEPYVETRGIVTYGATDDAWPISFRTGLVPRLENGIPTYPFSVQMDDETGEAVFSNANGTEFYFLPPALPEFASDWLRLRHGLPLFGEIPSYRMLSHVVSRWTLVHDSLAQDLSEMRSAPQPFFAPLRKAPLRLSASFPAPNPFQIQAIGLSSGEPVEFTIPFAWREGIVPTNGILDLWSSETLGSRNWSILESVTAAGSTNHVFSFSETNLPWYVPPMDCPAAHCGCPCCEPVVTTNFVGSVFDPSATNGVWVVATNSTCDCVRGTTSGFFTVFLRGDRDGDGLSDAEEVLNTDTDPFLFDMDGDGLCDADELSSGTNPKNADSDGDGVPDGRDAGEWSSHPYLAWSPENANFAMCRLWPVPPETSSVLWFDDLCLPLAPTQSVWYLRLPETNVVSCRLVLVGNPVLMLDCGPPESIGSWQFPHLPTTLGRTPVWCDNVSGVFTGNDSGGTCRFAVPRLVVSPEGSHCVHSPDGRVPISCSLEPSLCETVLSFEGSGAVSVDGNGPYIALGDRDSVTGTLLTTCAASPFSGPYFWGTFTNTVSAHRCTAGGVGQCLACGRVHTPEHACFHETDCSARFHSESNCTCTVFIPIGETVSLRVLGANDCCCDVAADGYGWIERSSSASLRTSNDQGNLEILSTTNSPTIGGFSVSYEIRDESNALVRAVTVPVTSGAISVRPDFSGGYALENQFGPPEERFVENGVWSVARRAEPYPIVFENAVPADAVLSVSFTAAEDGPSLRTEDGDSVPWDGTPVSGTDFVAKNERRTLYLDASAPGHGQATITYELSAPDGRTFLSESLGIHIVDTTVGDHVAKRSSSERLTWDYSGVTSNVWMGLAAESDSGYTILEYEEGERVQVSLDHPIGDYVLEAHFPHVWSGYDSIGMVSGAVHIVPNVDILRDAYAVQCGSTNRVNMVLDPSDCPTSIVWRISPSVENGPRIHLTSSDQQGSMELLGGTNVWISAGTVPGAYTITAQDPTCAYAHDTAVLLSVRIGINGDYFRNGTPVDHPDEGNPVDFDSGVGMVIPCNNNDSDEDGIPDCEDFVINGSADMSEFRRIDIDCSGISEQDMSRYELTAILSIRDVSTHTANIRTIHLFDDSSTVAEYVDSDPFWNCDITDMLSGSGEWNLIAEGCRHGTRIRIDIDYYHADSETPFGGDSMMLLVSPFIVASNCDSVDTVLVSGTFGWEDFRNDVANALPNAINIVEWDSGFIQDWAEIGTSCDGHRSVYSFKNNSFDRILSQNTGFFCEHSGDSRIGGNIEAYPPLPNHRYGIILKGETTPVSVCHFFENQGLQLVGERLLELPTKWLEVGHVDEIVCVIPSPCGIKILVPDLDLAVDLLTSDRQFEFSQEFEYDKDFLLLSYTNAANVARIEWIRNKLNETCLILTNTLGLASSSIIRIPVPFRLPENMFQDEAALVRSYFTNPVNAIVLPTALNSAKILFPSPEYQPFADAILNSMLNIGYSTNDICFINTIEPSRFGGGAHCSSNTIREFQ